MCSSSNFDFQTIASLLKKGRAAEVQAFFKATSANQSSVTFVSYMDELISKSNMNRSQIIAKAGLSRDYMYKVLRGDRKTTERDFIIAVCLSMKAGLLPTQKVLELYPFPVLDNSDLRSTTIMCALDMQADILTLNEWLEQLNQPLLRTSPDMPRAQIGPSRSTVFPKNVVNSKADEEHESSKLRRLVQMEPTNTFVVAERYGPAPFDYFYMGEFELTDDEGKHVYAQAAFYPDGISVYAIVPTSAQDTLDYGPDDYIEVYDSLEEARGSAYFSYFYELEKLTDQKAAETIRSVDDTRTYGYRSGGAFKSGGFLMHSESYNSERPELSEYLQVRQTPDGYEYSVSHKSYFMQDELGDFYEPYFGKPDPQLFLLKTTSLDHLGAYAHYKNNFMTMVQNMRQEFEKIRTWNM